MLLRGGGSTGSNACAEHAVSTAAEQSHTHTHTFHLFPFTMNITTKKILIKSMVPIISLRDRTDLKDLEKNIGEKPKDDTEINQRNLTKLKVGSL